MAIRLLCKRSAQNDPECKRYSKISEWSVSGLTKIIKQSSRRAFFISANRYEYFLLIGCFVDSDLRILKKDDLSGNAQ